MFWQTDKKLVAWFNELNKWSPSVWLRTGQEASRQFKPAVRYCGRPRREDNESLKIAGSVIRSCILPCASQNFKFWCSNRKGKKSNFPRHKRYYLVSNTNFSSHVIWNHAILHLNIALCWCKEILNPRPSISKLRKSSQFLGPGLALRKTRFSLHEETTGFWQMPNASNKHFKISDNVHAYVHSVSMISSSSEEGAFRSKSPNQVKGFHYSKINATCLKDLSWSIYDRVKFASAFIRSSNLLWPASTIPHEISCKSAVDLYDSLQWSTCILPANGLLILWRLSLSLQTKLVQLLCLFTKAKHHCSVVHATAYVYV